MTNYCDRHRTYADKSIYGQRTELGAMFDDVDGVVAYMRICREAETEALRREVARMRALAANVGAELERMR